MYLAAYSLFAGFGYLMVDPLFYRPGQSLGDWKQVVAWFGGGWEVRFPLILGGAAGTLWAMTWLSRSTLRFLAGPVDRVARVRLALVLLLVPYVGVNFMLTVLSLWHPIGVQGTVIALLKYWSGYVGFFWGFFIAGYWMRAPLPFADATDLPDRPGPSWWIAAGVSLGIAVFVLLPTVHFR
jgi:hypothetical protein